MIGRGSEGVDECLSLPRLAFFRIQPERFILLVITAWAAYLRLYDLGRESFSLDEGISLSHASSLSEVATDIHAPLYYLLLYAWTHLVGTSETAVRTLSALSGTLAVVMIYEVGASWFRPRAGLVAALFLSLSTFHIFHSRNGRMYELLVLFSLLSMYWFVRLVKQPDRRPWMFYVVNTALLAYTHAYGWLIIAAQWAGLAIAVLAGRCFHKPLFVRWLQGQLIVGALYAPWLWQSMSEARLRSIDWIPAPTLSSPSESLLVFASGSRYLVVLYGLLALSSALSLELVRRDSAIRRQWGWLPRLAVHLHWGDTRESYLLLWFCLPFGLALLVSALIRPVYQTHYLAGASVALYLAAGHGLARVRQPILVGLVLALVLFVSVRYLLVFYTTVQDEQWREAAHYVDELAADEDLLVFESVSPDRVFDRCSSRPELRRVLLDTDDKPFDDAGLQRFAALAAGYRRLWLIQSHSVDPGDALGGALQDTYVVARRMEFVRVSVRLFEANAQPISRR